MSPLILDIPSIAITGSSGKTSTREMITSVIERKWKILKTTGNFNLPRHTKEMVERYDPSIQAIILELGMGKQGAGEKHCSYIQPNMSIITNIGSAHYGNLGNSLESTAKFKSVLIKNMKPDGILFLNKDDKNSELLDTTTFIGELITVGIENSADYQAREIEYLDDGISLQITLDNVSEKFFIPVFGFHNVYNALFAIATCHRLKFTPSEIRLGLENHKAPIKRLNFIALSNQSLLINDTVNANPESVKTAIDVMIERAKDKKKIVVLGSMLELGDYTVAGHKEVGKYIAEKKVDEVYTFGEDAKWIGISAVAEGCPRRQVHHFENRDNLHRDLKKSIDQNSIILVKGSSLMKMDTTVQYIQNRFMYSISFDKDADNTFIYLSEQTLQKMKIESNNITLHFGALTKNYQISIDDTLAPGKIILSSKLANRLSIPDLPYEYYIEENQLFLGPVIGLLIYPRYYQDPRQQLLRFSNYDKIKGLIFLFRPTTINLKNKTIKGFYFNPETKTFIFGTFPYPSVIFNRLPLKGKMFKYLKKHVGNIFNYPYQNTNKLDFWKQMSKQPEIIPHLPLTQKYENVNSLLQAFKKFDSVYLKPTTLAGGKGIFHVKSSNEGYVLSDNLGNTFPIKSRQELSLKLKENLEQNRQYIIQQEISCSNNLGNKIDFRVYLQKDYTKKWKYSGMETKVAKTGSIISNSTNRERVIPGETALMEIYGLDENQAKQKIREISRLCIKVLKVMEQNGYLLGDAAVDLVIDQNHYIWLLEVQLNYCAELKAWRTEDEQQVLPMILPKPFEYAKALAGF